MFNFGRTQNHHRRTSSLSSGTLLRFPNYRSLKIKMWPNLFRIFWSLNIGAGWANCLSQKSFIENEKATRVKMEAKFRTFYPIKLGEGWTQYLLSKLFEFSPGGPKLLYSFEGASLSPSRRLNCRFQKTKNTSKLWSHSRGADFQNSPSPCKILNKIGLSEFWKSSLRVIMLAALIIPTNNLAWLGFQTGVHQPGGCGKRSKEIRTRSSAIAERPRCNLFKLWQKYKCEKRASNSALCYGVNVDESSFYCSMAPCLYLMQN